MLPKKPRRGDLIRWAGGKRALAAKIAALLPPGQFRYCEPFLGGGAVFLELLGQNRLSTDSAWLGDANPDLIAFWDEVVNATGPEDCLDELVALAKTWDTGPDGYARVRAFEPKTRLLRAARFLYVNEIGFNGLWRVNASGHLNTPRGDRDAIAMTSARLREVGGRASGVVGWLDSKPWKVTANEFLAEPAAGAACLYLDPPYHPGTSKAFTSYGPAFGPAEHEDLAAWTRRAIMAHPRLTVVVSNSDIPEVRALWQGFEIHEVREARSINSDGQGRAAVRTLLLVHRATA